MAVIDEESLSYNEASQWVAEEFQISVSPSNISYLTQYGHLRKIGVNGSVRVLKHDLRQYYSARQNRENEWKERLGENLNWDLSFDQFREAERTKHVHRLHPYKGKFIPQLVEYFLDQHIDEYKTKVFFRPGEFVLDPFCGSGTTLVQANEMGINAVGVDVSEFNVLLGNVKVSRHRLTDTHVFLQSITKKLREYVEQQPITQFEGQLDRLLGEYNARYFPSNETKRPGKRTDSTVNKYGLDKAELFLARYYDLVNEFGIELEAQGEGFLSHWYLPSTLSQIRFVADLVEKAGDSDIRQVAQIVLSRTIRSCRATKHLDLATLKDPVNTPYYCRKHGKICRPLFSIVDWWTTYAEDSIKRLGDFDRVRTATHQVCLVGDSTDIDIFDSVMKWNPSAGRNLQSKKFRGIFSSPPYVGMIDYHEQHAYAYELFGIPKREESEIGRMRLGQSARAKQHYIDGIAQVLTNCRRFMVDDFDVFLVANDKYGLYPQIANQAAMRIVKQHVRPVLRRNEFDQGAYSESIFHIKSL